MDPTATFVQIMLEKFHSLVMREEELLAGVETGVRDIKDELESIKSSMREAEAEDQKDSVKTWMRQLREVEYDMEDLVDEFSLHFGEPPGYGLSGFLRKSIHFIKNLRVRRRIGTSIQEIKAQLYNISQRKNMYAINSILENPSLDTAKERLHDRHVEALFIEEAELVGIEPQRQQIIDWLVKGKPNLKVISVVGMGGLGKTLLVRRVYDNEIVRASFNCHAWITLTNSCTFSELLRSIIIQFFREWVEPLPERLDIMEDIQLVEVLRCFLRDKRYVVVLDDVWKVRAWNYLKFALPDHKHGSRILVTTRINDVAVSCLESSGHIYHLRPLSPIDAWSLFCKKAFQSIIPGQNCPPHLEDIARDIVRICGGLPLAIATIGGLLSKKVTVLDWKTMHDNLQSELANNPKLEPIKRILSLSFSDLPRALKNCFLYFSIFPKGHAVKRITLIRLWIAEGFIETEEGKTMEQVAEDYLKDLIDRSLVQVAEYYDYGRVISCKVHDLLREIIILKSKDENFSTSTPLTRRDLQNHGKIRRLSIVDTSDCNYNLEDVCLSQLRAFFMFGANTLSPNSFRTLFSGFRLLKVLDLEGAPIQLLPLEFEKLLHLRYLSLRGTRIKKLPKSLGKLKNLETLDLKGTDVAELPKSIVKLQNLRHVIAYNYFIVRNPTFYYTNGVRMPHGIGNLRELQKLSYAEVDNNKCLIRELGKLTQLKRLGVVKVRTEDGRDLCASIQKIKDLQSFSVTSISMDEIIDLQYLTNPPPCLQRLYLRGPLQALPEWIAALNNLVRMRLRWSRLKEDSLEILQALPNLAELTLIHAYDGIRLKCGKGGFQKLRILDLEELAYLNYVIIDGSMPNLRKMYIRRCTQLKSIPMGIEQLKNLKELHLLDMPETFIQKLQGSGSDHEKVKHIPILGV